MRGPGSAIREADATGEVAAIFGDIRVMFGLGFVKLLGRHLAILPGGLGWAWGRLRA